MSRTTMNREQAQSTSRDDLHLTAVQVAFNKGRPKGQLKLVVALNNEDHTVKAGGDADLRWSGSIHCLLSSTAQIRIYLRRRMRWEEFASIEVLLSTDFLLASDTLQVSQTFATVMVTDSAQLMAVTFRISESDGFLKLKAAREQEEEQAERTARELAEKAAREQAEKKTLVLGKLGEVRSLLNILKPIFLNVGTTISEIPVLGFLVQICERQDSRFEQVMKLIDPFDLFLSVRARVKYLVQNAEARRAIETMLNLVGEGSEYVFNYIASHALSARGLSLQMPRANPGYGGLLANEDEIKLIELKAGFSRAKAAFDHSIEPTIELEFLHKKLLKCRDIHSRFGEEDICLDGTRVDLLGRIMNWIDDRDHTDTKPGVFWLRGRAGSGKTTIASTLAQAAQDSGYPVSSFFCRRDDQNSFDPHYLLPTLAYRYAQEYESYRAAIFKLLCTDQRCVSIITTANLHSQLDRLFREPLEKKTLDLRRPHVLIIDALDECRLPEEQANIAQCVLALARLAPWIKVIVTSRDSHPIRDVFARGACVQCDIDEDKDVDRDIRRYIRLQTNTLGLQLSDEDVEQLIERAEGLFVWCSTLFKYLSKRRTPREDLQAFLSGGTQKDLQNELHRLYDTVLKSATDTQEDISLLRAILSILDVVAGNRPLSAKAVATFLHDHEPHSARSEDQIYPSVHKLHAVCYIDKSVDAVIRVYHSSFYDYLRWKSTDVASGWERHEDVHGRMFRSCMRILDTQLRFNMCKIERPILNEDVPDLAQRVAENMSEELQYSSLFWFNHLASSTSTRSDAAPGVLSLLCSKKLLFWLEALSLQGSLFRSILAFEVCTHSFHGFFNILVAANNARRAVRYLFEAMDSVPHIYLSSLFWLPRNSRTYRDLELARLKHLQLIENKRDDWEAVLWKQSEGRELYSVVFSPDGKHVASGADNGVVYIRSVRTGALEKKISSGANIPISSLACSPDGSLIASGSSDSTVRVWDVKSSKEVFRPLTGHTGSVNSVAFSPDGQYIASSSNDGTVRVWSARTGAPEGEPLRGHRGWVLDLAYSPDGLHLASAGYDCDVRVWSTVTYQETMRISRGHQRGIQSVAFSPDGYTVISGSRDYTIQRWDAHSGEAVGEPMRGHTGSVWSVMYSPGGFFILSSSEDCTIRIWDAVGGAPVGESLCGHRGWVRSISCSPNGLLIASASDDMTIRVWDTYTDSRTPDTNQIRRGHSEGVRTVAWSPNGRHISTSSTDRSICLWDVETGAAIGESLRGHSHWVRSAVFSPDGLFIVSGSDDYTVRIWDAQTGNPIGEPLRGHSGSVWSVACSPGGRRIASASTDGTVRLWDAQTRTLIGEPLQIGGWALSIAFSPDGRSLACGTRNGTVQIWDVSSNASLKMTWHGHSHWVLSVAFSPSDRLIASGSHDRTVRLWGAQTGEPRGSPLIGHTSTVHCVAFSPDGRLIASCSSDCTVRLWDTRTGQALGDPLRGHSDWVWSVAFSPDGRSLASGGKDRKTFVYNVPSADPSLAEVETRWSTCCSRMDDEDGWVKDGDALLLWVPPLYRPVLRAGARAMINEDETVASRVDFETLLRYSGKDWVNILTDA